MQHIIEEIYQEALNDELNKLAGMPGLIASGGQSSLQRFMSSLRNRMTPSIVGGRKPLKKMTATSIVEQRPQVGNMAATSVVEPRQQALKAFDPNKTTMYDISAAPTQIMSRQSLGVRRPAFAY